MIDRRTFLGMGMSAFASAGVLPAFALDDRQQWYEPEVTDNEDGTYTVKYSGLPRIAEDREIVYSVKEDMINGYAAEPDEAEDGGTIVNKHIPAVTTLTVKKVWNDAEDQDGIRPEKLEVVLSDGTETVQTVILTAENGWSPVWPCRFPFVSRAFCRRRKLRNG